MFPQDFGHEHQAQALARRLGGDHVGEYPLGHFLRNRRSGVADCEGLPLGLDVDESARAGVLGGILNNVEYHLLHLYGVKPQRHRLLKIGRQASPRVPADAFQ